MSQDASNGSLLAQSVSKSGNLSVRFRKGEKNDKDVFIEVWVTSRSQAHRSVLKVTDKMTKVYNDSVFGGICWSKDESKICFVGEMPEPASYKNHWEPKKEEEKKNESAQEEEKKDSDKKPAEEEKKEEFFQDSKFLLNRDFGEMLVDKKNPAIFIFDLEKNTLNQLQGMPKDLYPQYPIFDETSEGIVFSGVRLPYFKLGLIYCLNRPMQLYHVASPVFDKKKLNNDDAAYIR